MLVRPILPADAEVIAGWRYAFPYSDSDFSDASRTTLLDPANGFHVVEVESELVGVVGYRALLGERDTPRAERVVALSFARSPDRVGKGDGHRFMSAILAFIAAAQPDTICLAMVREWNTACRRLLVGAGFRFIRRDWHPLGETTLVYALQLDARDDAEPRVQDRESSPADASQGEPGTGIDG